MKAFCIKTLLVIPLLVSAVLTGTVLAPTLAHARVYDPGFLPCAIGDRPFTDDEGKKWCDTEPAADENAATNAATTEPAEGGNIVSDIVDAGVNILARPAIAAVLGPFAIAAFGILTLSSVFLWLAGVVFNWAVQVLVFQFAVYLGNTTGMLTAWGILRDFGNIILLFGFVYMGIQTILQIGHYSVGRALSRLVIFAVLLNFSLFIAEAVIDTANVLASTVYNQTYASSPAGARCQGALECGINDGIASVVLNHAGVGSVLTQNNSLLGELGNYVSNPLGTMVKYLLLAFLMFTAAIVLFAGAFMLISRGIFLAFLMVTSPIGFAGMAVPWLEKMAKDWWDKLIQQALFAPVFLILLFVGLKLMEGMRSISGGGTLASAVTAGGTLNTGPILVFVLVIGFMIAALLAANKFGIYGSEAVTKFSTGAIGRFAGATTLGAAGVVGRRTIGAGANAFRSRLMSSDWARSNPNMARIIAGGAQKIAGSSMDARSSLKALGVDIGKPSDAAKKGYDGTEKEAKEARVKFGEELELTEAEEKKKKGYEKSIEEGEAALRTLGQKQRNDLATLDATHQAAKAEKQAESAELDARHKSAREPYEEAVRAAQIAAARASADPVAKAAADASLLEAQHALEDIAKEQKEEREVLKSGLEKLAQEQAAERSRMQKAHQDDRDMREEDLRLQREQLKAIKSAPQKAFAKVLEEKRFYPPGSVGSAADKAAAHEITKHLKEDDIAKLRRAFASAGGGHGGGGSHDDHAAAAPKAKPAAGGGGGHAPSGGDHH